MNSVPFIVRIFAKMWPALLRLRLEFPSWLAWKVFDSLFALLIYTLAKRFKPLEDRFKMLGWL